MKKIAKLLKADLNGSSDLAAIAAMLAGKGRGNDTLLAHITPKEAEILKAAGGSGTTNPETGLLEFYDDVTASGYDAGGGGVTDEYGFVGTGGAVETQTPEASKAFAQLYPGEDRTIQLGADTTTTFPVSGKAYAGTPPTYAQTSQAEDVMFGGTAGGAPQGQALPTGQGAVFSPTGAPYTPRDLSRISVDRAPIDQPSTAVPPPQEKSFFDKLTTEQMARLGLAGGLGVLGAQRARQGAGQIQAATQEQKALAQPYQAQGQELVRAAQAGELTPASQQRLQATQAAIAQGVESRGGVGAQQAAAQVEALRQQLLQNQYTYGLQIAQVGDNIALGAIRTGLQLDNSLQQATGNFYTNLAMVAGGIPMARA
jgi:hypothetical protein